MLCKDYIAGFFDGEGHVCIAHTPNGSKTGSRIFRLQVGIAQKNKRLFKELIARFGGRLHLVAPGGSYQWTVQCKTAETFLRYIASAVVLKDKVVALAIKFRDLGRINTPARKRRAMQIRLRIQKLNQID